MPHRSLVFALTLLLASPAWAVQGNVAHFFVYRMVPGATTQFEDGYRRHLDWHKAHHDPLVWYGWTIEDGERDGYFVDANVGEPFAAFDHRVDVADDGTDFHATVAPYATPMGRPTYVLLRNFSTGTPLENRKPSAVVQVTHFHLRPGMEPRFERAIQAVHKALAGNAAAPAHTWYRLVTGGDTPQYMLMVSREDWASYDRFEQDIAALLAGDEAALRDFADAVQSSTTESWRYRQELSRLP
ncbi:hypothetical protein [Dyella koreensis]|uniref:NIPSNAP protein n=1 Tax=Dyella koreensis TaxID=311235 RepID=A0ABW8KEA8_9GAMM